MSVPKRAQNLTDMTLDNVIPDESQLTAGTTIVAGESYGFFTDTTLCIGCKACEVACKVWNDLPSEVNELSGMSYDNTRELSAETWRHVAFVEQIPVIDVMNPMEPFQSNWLMSSDVCKHCAEAPCLEACPTGAIFRTEFDTVVIQADVCNGCGYCVPSCPFGVVEISKTTDVAQKCTLCYDRLEGGLEPACAKSCPTDSIQFGRLPDLVEQANQRIAVLHEQGHDQTYLYGTPDSPGATGGLGQLNAFFLLADKPEVYNLPSAPRLPSRVIKPSLSAGAALVAGLAVAAIGLFKR